jgi:hypothetical protein
MLNAQAQKQKGKTAKTSLLATWQAITALPTDHFPLMLPGVHRIAAFFILRTLKRSGYSACRVDTTVKGLVVYAQR